MKKIVAFALCSIMVTTLLAGCGGSSSDTGDSVSDTGATASTDSGDYPTVVLAFMNWTGPPAGIDRIEEKISEYTRETVGANVQLEIMDAASYNQNLTLMLSSGEQVDIFNAISIGYTSSVNKGYTLDLEEDDLIATHGADILTTLDADYINACRIDGILYGLPNQRDMAIGMYGFAIGAEYLDTIGYDYSSKYESEDSEIIYSTFDEINTIYAQLHEAYPDKYVLMPQEATLTQGPAVDAVGGDNFGVLLDPENSLVVEDMFTSEAFYELCSMMYNWNQLGYMSQDALTDDTAATSQAKAGTVMSYLTATKPGIKQQESNLCGREMIIFQCGEDFMKASSVAAMPWCINSGTEDPVLAMKVLNAFYSDPYLSNLLCWGEEGVEYQKTEDGHITFAEGITAESSQYYNNVNWQLPNQFIAEIWEGDSLDIWTKMETFNKESVKSKALGFAFDNSSVASEYTALMNVYNEYGKALFYGFADPDTSIAEFESKLQSAGLQTYMEAKQAALDQWAADNGVK